MSGFQKKDKLMIFRIEGEFGGLGVILGGNGKERRGKGKGQGGNRDPLSLWDGTMSRNLTEIL